MGSLIPFAQRFIAGKSTRTVSARTLYEFLGAKRDFSTWIKARIEQYDFEEKTDYIAIPQKRGIGTGKGLTDFYLTLDMAKELAMVERNEKGKQARRYFINCEKQLQQKQLQKQLAPATVDDLVNNCKDSVPLEAILYRSHKEPCGVRVFMTIENGKVNHVKQLKDTEVFMDVKELIPIMDVADHLKHNVNVYAALAAAKA